MLEDDVGKRRVDGADDALLEEFDGGGAVEFGGEAALDHSRAEAAPGRRRDGGAAAFALRTVRLSQLRLAATRAGPTGRKFTKMLNPRVVIQTMITLASASLGLVAALAWNEAIKETIKQAFGTDDNLAGLYTYAVLATLVAVVVLLLLARAASRLGGEAAISREAEG